MIFFFDEMTNEVIKKLAVQTLVSSPDNLFDDFFQRLDKHHGTPATNIQELRAQNTKVKGDLLEAFCVLYLKHIMGMEQVYLYSEVPGSLRTSLGLLNKQDMGIDIVASKGSQFYAVQCKYRKHSNDSRNNIVPWSSISTFYGLCARSGPWSKLITMTTALGVRRAGGYQVNDLTVARGSFRKLTVDQWYKLFEIKGQTLVSNIDKDAMLEARLKRFTC